MRRPILQLLPRDRDLAGQLGALLPQDWHSFRGRGIAQEHNGKGKAGSATRGCGGRFDDRPSVKTPKGGSTMAAPAPDLRNLTDDQIWERLHHGMVDSPLHRQCILMLEMRNAERQSKSASAVVTASDLDARGNYSPACSSLRLSSVRDVQVAPMTARFPRILLVLLCLIALATSASAECAWVLWDGQLPSAPGFDTTWIIAGTYPSANDCDAQLTRAVSFFRQHGYEVSPPQSGTAVYTGKTQGYLHCLPDTVDPRGPKGK